MKYQITGWSVAVLIEGDTYLAPTWTLTAGIDFDPAPDAFLVELATDESPLIPDESDFIVLAEWSALITETFSPIYISLVAGSDQQCDVPCYDAVGLDSVPFFPVYGWGLPATTINDPFVRRRVR